MVPLDLVIFLIRKQLKISGMGFQKTRFPKLCIRTLKPIQLTIFLLVVCTGFFYRVQANATQHNEENQLDLNSSVNNRLSKTHKFKGRLTADFILCKLVQDGMDFAQTGYATTTRTDDNNRVLSLKRGAVIFTKFNWERGFKIGFGADLAYDDWKFFAEYQWIRSSGNKKIKNNGGIWPLEFLPLEIGDTIYPNAMTSRQVHRYNVLNFDFGRDYQISRSLMLYPYFGLSNTWQQVEWDINYDEIALFNINGINVGSNDRGAKFDNANLKYRNNNKYWGTGIRVGLKIKWHLTRPWSIFANIALTNMWSVYKLDEKAQLSGTNNITQEKASNFTFQDFGKTKKLYKIKFVNELELGMQWELDRLLIQVAWTETIWVNHMAFIHGARFTNFYDLSLHGLDIKLLFNF